MDPLQGWLVIGIPAVAIVAAMFARRSPVMSAIGYLVIAVTFVAFLTLVDDPMSAAAIGLIGTMILASGRGGAVEEQHEETHVPMWLDAAGRPVSPDGHESTG